MSHKPEDPAAQHLIPHTQHRDAEEMAEGKDIQRAALGCVQREQDILWEIPSGSQEKGARLSLLAGRATHRCP